MADQKRFAPREGDRTWQKVLAAFIRAPWLGKLVVELGVCTLIVSLVFRFLVLDKVFAQDTAHSGRMTAIEVEVAVLKKQQEEAGTAMKDLRRDAGVLMKAECRRNSKAWQEQLDMPCPPNLYLGAQLESR